MVLGIIRQKLCTLGDLVFCIDCTYGGRHALFMNFWK